MRKFEILWSKFFSIIYIAFHYESIGAFDGTRFSIKPGVEFGCFLIKLILLLVCFVLIEINILISGKINGIICVEKFAENRIKKT